MIIWQIQRLMNSARGALAAPSRNARMAVVIGRLLGIAFIVCFGTGLYSHFLQDPLPWMVFPTRPIGLYQLSQGIHITTGILCFPLIFAKLYTVFPNLLETPPIRSFPHFLERASITIFVAASLVEITIGLLNTYQWYALFPFPFRQTHYALSFVIIGSLAIHIAIKLPIINQFWRKKNSYDADGNVRPIAVTVAAATPVRRDEDEARDATGGGHGDDTVAPTRGITGRVFGWIDHTPAAPPRSSRRAFLTTISLAGAVLVITTAGQSFRVLDFSNVFGARKKFTGPNALPVNRTAKAAKVEETATAGDWALTVSNGTATKAFTLAQLAALPQYRVDLPIACVEGWSQMASWKGPRLRDLVDAVGASADATVKATSLEKNSSYAVTRVGPEFVRDELTLVALEVNGETLDLDHGYPARIISPGRPGVLQTKWLSSLEVLA
ncbi:molybdopterin-dependent oxidoreductase [Glaciihabitans sp. dw_435]|uniref:molybdopterin-dependent oxidoreductase n=1 Tax=Glaciihabitans sp. dw_435 TaxID=2720081 RepID=UPI001C49DDA0|nr:molybdopterin-dependent oxidoreductase [Glaciihabitans sp. dw_435]